MKTLKQLEQEYEEAQAVTRKIYTKIQKKLSKTLVQCTSCKMGHTIDSLEYIQTHWYESPYGCTGGDNWHSGEGNFMCPHCGGRNRLYDRPEIEELKHLFKSSIDEHEGH